MQTNCGRTLLGHWNTHLWNKQSLWNFAKSKLIVNKRSTTSFRNFYTHTNVQVVAMLVILLFSFLVHFIHEPLAQMIGRPHPVFMTLINHYITSHYITLRYVTLHYITLHYITLHYITLHYITLRYITLRYITLYWTMLCCWHRFI